jgi:hypothetical protein
MFASGDTVQNYVSNLPKSADNLSRKSLVRNLCNLSGYRYLPVALKPFFWCYSDDVNNNIFKSNNMYKIDETQYDKIGGFSKTDSTNYFKYYHFHGEPQPIHSKRQRHPDRQYGCDQPDKRQLPDSFTVRLPR